MDYKAIVNLMKEMNNTDLTKLEIEEEGIRICMEKAANTVTMVPAMQPQVAAGQVSTAAGIQLEISETAIEKQVEEAGKKIVSPMVGTFYVSPSPDKPAFVKAGVRVKKGQTVCIIEAMKLLNEIESDVDGEIVKVLVNNEEMVEFGQPLFLVK
jgi:acetyl-CoA carboxylase biotin carboxyl carrier protein